jgi:hypothetical protein
MLKTPILPQVRRIGFPTDEKQLLNSPKLYLESPDVIDTDLLGRLDTFKDRDPGNSWAWFVQGTDKGHGA